MAKALLLVSALLLLAPMVLAQGPVYVDASATGAGDGSSWADAFTTVQAGANAARDAGGGMEVWVAHGTYAAENIHMYDDTNYTGISLLGGFASGDGIDDRDPSAKVVVISAGEGQRCLTIGNDVDDVVIDGFTLQGFAGGNGGGIHAIYAENLTLRNLNISAQWSDAANGAGMNIEGGSAAVENVLVDGGTAYNGAGLRTWSTTVAVVNSTFSNGTVGQHGGGAYLLDGTHITFDNCVFSGNAAAGGGGGVMWDWGAGTSSFTNCLFVGNTNGWYVGGAIGFAQSDSAHTVENCIFTEHSGAGVVAVDGVCQGGVSIVNGLFAGNAAAGSNGVAVMSVYGGLAAGQGHVNVVNCTLAHNGGDNSNGSMYLMENASATILNTIAWGNAGVDVNADPGAGVTVNYSLIESGWDPADGVGNLAENPLFADPAGGDFRLQETSPALDAGDADDPLVPAHDLLGDPRPGTVPGVSMGAFEEGVDVVYVTIPDVTGLSVDDAIAELEALGLDVSVTEEYNDTVEEDGVIGTNPSAGTEVPMGSAVGLVVSLGPVPQAQLPAAGLTALFGLVLGLGTLAARRATSGRK